MAEEIVSIKGVVGNLNTNLAVSTATNGLSMAGITSYLDKKTSEMVELVTSVTTPTTKYMSDIFSELKSLTHATDTWNEYLLEGIINSSEQLLNIAKISEFGNAQLKSTTAGIDLMLDGIIETTNELRKLTVSAETPDTLKTTDILTKLILNNEAFLRKLDLEDILSPLQYLTANTDEKGNKKLNIDFNIKSNFDIRSLSDFLNTSKLYNPAAAFMFKRSIGTYAEGISKALSIMLPMFKESEIEKLNAGAETLVKLSTLIATTKETSAQFSLFGKQFIDLGGKESVWTKNNANKFKAGLLIATDAIAAGIKAINKIPLGANGIKKLDTILKFFQGIAGLLQGEIVDSKGVSFSIGSLLKFDGPRFSKQIKNFNQKTVKKFKKTADAVAEAIFEFFTDINNIPEIDQSKYGQLITVLASITQITANMAEMKKPDKSIYASVMSIKWIMNVVDSIEINKNTLKKVDNITSVMNSVYSLAEMMSVMSKPKTGNVATTLLSIWATVSVVTSLEKITSAHQKNLIAISDAVSTMARINTMFASFEKPKSIIHTLLSIWEVTWVVNRLEKIDNQAKKNLSAVAEISTTLVSVSESLNKLKKPKNVTSTLISSVMMVWALNIIKNKDAKSALKNTEVIVQIATTLSEGMKQVDKDTYKSAKNVSKSINAITFSMTMLAVLSAPVKVANKTLQSITKGISSASKSLSKKEVSNAAKNMKMLAGGMAILGLASVAFAVLSPAILVACLGMKMLKWGLKSLTSTKMLAKMSMFSIGLATFGLAIWAFGEIVNPEGMVKTAGGIAMLAGAMWLFNGGGKWKGIRTGKGDPTKGMLKAAGALAILGLATYVWQELVEWGGIPKIATGIGLLAGATWAFSKIKGNAPKNMIEVAVGVGAMGLATAVWQLFVKPDIEMALFMGAVIGGAGAAALLYRKLDPKKTTLSMLAVAVGIAAFGAATWIFSISNPSWGLIGLMAAVVGGAAALGYAYVAIPPSVILSMGAVATGVAAFGGAVWLWSMAGATWETIGMIGAIVGGGAAAAALYAIPIIPIGAGSMILVGGALLAIVGAVAMAKSYDVTVNDAITVGTCVWELAKTFAKVAVLAVPALLGATLFTPVAVETAIICGSLALMTQLPIPDEEKVTSFNDAVWALCKGYSKVAALAIPALLGATLFTPVAVETALIAGSMALLSVLQMPESDHVDKFNYATWAICKGFAKIAVLAIPAALGATLFMPVALSTVMAGGALALIEAINLPAPEKISECMDDVKVIVKGWNKLGIFQMLKASAKGALFTPVGVATILAAGSIKLLGEIDLDPEKIRKNTDILFEFINVATTKFNEISKGKRAKAIKEGAEAVGKVSKVIHDIGEAVYKIASLEYVTHKVNAKGELIPDKVLKLTDKDFEMVAEGVAKILTSLTDPLVKIGEAKGDDVHIGPFTIPGENKVKEGVEAISGIGGAIMPLGDLVKSIAESGILKDKDSEILIDKLNYTISAVVDSICKSAVYVIQRTAHIEFEDSEGLQEVFDSIGAIYEPVSGIIQSITESGLLEETKDDGEKWIRFSYIFDSIVDAIGDNVAKIVPFIKSKGGWFSSSKTNAEDIVLILNNMGKMYEPLTGILKSITDTGILDPGKANVTKRLTTAVTELTGALTDSTTRIIEKITTKKKQVVRSNEAEQIMKSMGSMIYPLGGIIRTISKTGILDDNNRHGAYKLKEIIPVITSALSDAVIRIASMNLPDNIDVNKYKKLMQNVGLVFRPLSALLITLKATGILEDDNIRGAYKIRTIIPAITSALSDAISKILRLSKRSKGIDKLPKLVATMGAIFKPICALILTLKATGILDDENKFGAAKIKSIVPAVTSAISESISNLLTLHKKYKNIDKLPKLVATVGAIFRPLSTLIATLGASGILDDSNINGTSKIKDILTSITDAVVYTVSKLAGLETKGPTLENATRNLTEMFYQISKADPTGIQAIRSEIDAIYDKISDDAPWKKFGIHFVHYEKTAAKLQKDINKIDLRKLVLIKEFTDNLRKANLNGNIQSLVEEIRKLINAIEDQNDNWENNFNSTVGGDTNTTNNFGSPAVVGDQQIDSGSGNFFGGGADATPAAPTKNSNQAALQLIADKVGELARAVKGY